MESLRTPDDRFTDLPDYPYEPRYLEVDGLRVAVVDEGPRDAAPVLMLHGEPSWGFLYRTVARVLLDEGNRVVVPDLVGFGRSDKPTEIGDHSYARHVAWMRQVVEQLDLRETTMVGQDWGGLIGLRLVAEAPERYARIVVANTGLPVGSQRLPEVWQQFRTMVVESPDLDVARIVDGGCVSDLSPQVLDAYNAPFPDDSYKAGPRALPDLVPQTPDDPAVEANKQAWQALAGFERPLLCAFSDSDPITAGG